MMSGQKGEGVGVAKNWKRGGEMDLRDEWEGGIMHVGLGENF